MLDSVTLVGGIKSGYFRDHGKVKDIQKCRRICCEMPHCNLAFMLSSNCFSVACKSADACKTQPANPSRYNPKISYVREYGSTELIGKVIVSLTQTGTLKTDRQAFLIQKNSIYSMGVMFIAYHIT